MKIKIFSTLASPASRVVEPRRHICPGRQLQRLARPEFGNRSINKVDGGLMQIPLRIKQDDNSNTVANYLNLHSENAGAASRPQWVIEYYIL
ncbi:MAG: hypothetical protein ACOYYJ_16620 [Chloroflexota bacterium]